MIAAIMFPVHIRHLFLTCLWTCWDSAALAPSYRLGHILLHVIVLKQELTQGVFFIWQNTSLLHTLCHVRKHPTGQSKWHGWPNPNQETGHDCLLTTHEAKDSRRAKVSIRQLGKSIFPREWGVGWQSEYLLNSNLICGHVCLQNEEITGIC